MYPIVACTMTAGALRSTSLRPHVLVQPSCLRGIFRVGHSRMLEGLFGSSFGGVLFPSDESQAGCIPALNFIKSTAYILKLSWGGRAAWLRPRKKKKGSPHLLNLCLANGVT